MEIFPPSEWESASYEVGTKRSCSHAIANATRPRVFRKWVLDATGDGTPDVKNICWEKRLGYPK